MKNPISNTENIRLINTNGLETFELYSITGQIVNVTTKFREGITELIPDNLSAGIYILTSNEINLKVIVR